MSKFTGATAVITGAAGGLGRALAQACAQYGTRLMLADIDGPRLETCRLELLEFWPQCAIEMLRGDVSQPDDAETLARVTMKRFGRVDFLFNNAGVDVVQGVCDITKEDWDHIFGVNVLGTIWGIKAFMPIMQKQREGHIVNVASAAGFMSVAGQGLYCASKAAVVALSEALALELRETAAPIRVTIAAPALFRSDILTADDTREHHSDFQKKWKDDLIQATSTARLTAADIAQRILTAVEKNEIYAFPQTGVKRQIAARIESVIANTLYEPKVST